MIVIVDYEIGNVKSIINALKSKNQNYKLSRNSDEIMNADGIILPGVGAFDATMQQLIDSGLRDELNNLVINNKVPILGICVGLQVMGFGSDEGDLQGLGWIPGKVKKFDINKIESKPKLPHMGWNTIKDINNHNLFKGIDNEFGFYFVHSFYFECKSEDNILTTSNYGTDFASSIYSNHIIGTQFHPEKSHGNGILLFKNFAQL